MNTFSFSLSSLRFVLGAIGLAIATWPSARAQGPANDAFADRIPLGRLIESIGATNTLATGETNEPPHRGSPGVKSLWWRWVAPLDGYAVVDSTNSAVRTRMAVYDGSKLLPLLQSETPRNESGLPGAPDHYEFSAANGLHYNLAIDGRNGDSGEVRLDLKVYTTPEILVQPSGATVTAGQRSNLTLRALGALPLTNQWQFSTRSPNTGFTNVPGGVNRQLDLGTFGVVSKGDEGWYRVIIRNQYGAITSAVARVEVNECAIPSLPQPLAVATNVGKRVALSGTAIGTTPLFFQWQFQPAGQFQFLDLPGATSSNLVLTNISIDQAGEYRFLASNIACTNQASMSAALSVSTNNALVLDTNLPNDLLLITNQNASFDVRVVEGYQPIRLQWWYSPDGFQAIRLTGETATNLFRPGVQLNQAGWYWLTASNHWGSCQECYTVVSSRPARLTVETRPPNDDFANRIPIFPAWTNLSTDEVSRTNVSGWNKNATAEFGEPVHQGSAPARSVWWSFTPPVDGRVLVTLTASGPAPVLAAYTGDAANRLVPVSNRTNLLYFHDFVATNNIEHLFAVESQGGDYQQNNINLNLTFNPDIGGPTLLGDFGGFDLFMLGGLGAGEGCRTFDRLTVAATSLDGVVFYQWQFGTTTNGPFADLPAMTNGTFVLPNVTLANQGWYRVRVSNRSTSVVYTPSVHLTVGVGPLIPSDGQPKSVATNACGTARFEVKAESCSPLAFQWRHNGLPVLATNAVGVNSNILYLTSLRPANEGNYDVIIRNANLSITSQVATLTVTNTPTITAQPQSVTRHGCEPASFRVAAIATCPLTYQWFFQGLAIDLATNNTLGLASIQPTDGGDYFVSVSTPFGSVTSQVARLTVQIAPAILAPPTAQSVRACDIVNLAVQAQAEPPCSFLNYQWQRVGTNIVDATNRTYSFEAQAETAGDYRVSVSNRWTTVTSAVARVSVDARPFVAAQPLSYQRVREGNLFTNRVDVSTCGALTYTWEFRPFGAATFSSVPNDLRHLVTSNGWLIVQNTQTNESGYYRVVAANIYASVTSSVAQVRVVRPPPNDYFANAISLGRTNRAITSGYNEFATLEPGEPNHGLQPPTRSVWWSWTSPFASLVTVDLTGSDIDTTLGAYTGAAVGNLTTLALDDDGAADGRSRVSFMAGSNKVVYLAVDGKRSVEGTNLVVSVSAVEITSPPVITQQPVSLAATIGETITFTNVAYGSPDVSIQWFGKGLPRQGLTRIVSLTNYLSTLTLSNVTANDDGVYYVLLSNSFGVVTSKLATLTFGALVRGFVTDATRTTPTGAAIGIPGVRVCIGDVCTVTDEDGNYELSGVRRGDLRADFLANKTRARLNEGVQFWNRSTATGAVLTATRDGYYDYVDAQFEVGPGQTVAKRFSMSPVFAGLRFVLNWTNKPSDLDLLLHFPPSVPVSYPWIDYLPRNRGSSTEAPYAIRDVDTTQGWGPETISIHRFYPGTYSLYARKYPGEGGYFLTQSAAQIVAYKGGEVVPGVSPQLRPYETIDVPTQGTNDWWHICDVDGLTTNITWINRLLTAAPGGLEDELGDATPAGGGGQFAAAGALMPSPVGLNYEWNFGDASPVSTQFEPVHSYADPGWKTVSLRVTQTGPATASNSLTRTNYIYVENVPPVVVITNPVPGLLFRSGDPITLQSEADGIDDGIEQVEYYLIQNQQAIFLGTATAPPYTWVFPNTNQVDRTNVFMALARDTHGATGWSAPVPTRTIDLRGDILIVRNFPSTEIERMVEALNEPMIHEQSVSGGSVWRSPLVKVLDQEGLYFELVRGFKLIIWNDQGQTNGGLTDNDVDILAQAYGSGIPIYLIGEQLGASGDRLNYETRLDQWIGLTGLEKRGGIPGPLAIRGIKPVYEDGLFYGWYPWWESDTNMPYSHILERNVLTGNSMDVIADISKAGFATNSPIMLRFPRFSQPDFGETRRLIQNFRPMSDLESEPTESAASAFDRKVLFINGCAWLLRLFECQEINVALNCIAPPPLPGALPDAQGRIASGQVGQPMTNVTYVTQNGECTSGGVIVTGEFASCVEVISASLAGVPNPGTYQATVTNNQVTVRFSELASRANYPLTTVTVPKQPGWVTNLFSATRGLSAGIGCVQTAFITGATGAAPVRLNVWIAANRLLHLSIAGGAGCTFQIESSADLRTWQNLIFTSPDRDPYDVTVAPPSDEFRFYRLRRSD